MVIVGHGFAPFQKLFFPPLWAVYTAYLSLSNYIPLLPQRSSEKTTKSNKAKKTPTYARESVFLEKKQRGLRPPKGRSTEQVLQAVEYLGFFLVFSFLLRLFRLCG
jgi:hypothetical protein